MEDWQRLIIGTDRGDDCVHVDAKTGEVHHGVHSTNASDCSLSLGVMRVGKVHDVLRCSFDLAQKLVISRLDMYRTKVFMYSTMVLMVCPTKVRC
jgi:hypothetical protein